MLYLMSALRDRTAGSQWDTAPAAQGKASQASQDAISPRSQPAGTMHVCFPLIQETSGNPGSKSQCFPLPVFTHMDFYSQDLHICGCTSIKQITASHVINQMQSPTLLPTAVVKLQLQQFVVKYYSPALWPV